MDMFWAMLLKPFLLLGFLMVGYPITYFVKHRLKDGWLKRLLLTKVS